MRVKLAKTAGFCMGVRRAMDIVLDASNKRNRDGTIYTYGPLIHNPQVLELLEKKGIEVADDKSDNIAGTVIIRAHGITPQERCNLKNKGAEICDATCPHVFRAQSIVKRRSREGYTPIIVGDPGHAEVIGLMGFAKDESIVVNSPDEVDNLPDLDKVCVVAQTTQDQELYGDIVEKIRNRFSECEVFDTICDSTAKRQAEARRLCEEVDAMVVVGGRRSANTNRLTTICKSTGTPTYHIETEKELDAEKLAEYNTIGITAGASTPNWIINRVVEHVRSIRRKRHSILTQWVLDTFAFVVRSDIYTAIGGAGLCLACCILMNIAPRLVYLLIASLYIFSMHVLNHFTDMKSDELNRPGKAEFFSKHKLLLITLASLSTIASIIIAAILGAAPFILMLFACVFGVVYRIKLFPSSLSKLIRYRSFEEIPGSKEIILSLAWSAVTVVLPLSATYSNHNFALSGVTVAILFAFGMTFIRKLTLHLKDIQGDRIVGKETIPIIIGGKNTRVLSITLLSLIAIALITFGLTSSRPAWYLLPCVLYVGGYLYMYSKKIIVEDITSEALVDGSFIFSGFAALLFLLVYR